MIVAHVSMSMVVLDWLLLADFSWHTALVAETGSTCRQIGFYALEDQVHISFF